MIGFPVEIQEYIFKLLDGATFTRCRVVCKLWNSLHDNVQERFPMWRDCCRNEISPGVLLHLTNSINITELMEVYAQKSKNDKSPWKIWKHLYSVWYRTRFVGKWVPLETFIQISGLEGRVEGYINCAKILGGHLVVGCQDGHVTFLDSLTGVEDHQFPVNIIHNVDVTDIMLMRLGNGVGYINSLPCYDHILSSTVWGTVKVTSLHDGSTTESADLGYVGSLDSWGHTVMIENNRYGADQCELLTAVQNKSGQFLLTHLRTVLNYDWGCSQSQIWEDKVLCGGIDQLLMIHPVSQKGHSRPTMGEENVQFLMSHIEEKYVEDIVYKAGVALCLTDNGFIHASIDDGCTWASWNTMIQVGSKPTKLALWGPLLAVAFLSGQINVYYMPDKSDYMTSFLGNPHAVIHIEESSSRGVYMDIGDDGEGPMIVIVVETGIKVVRWFHPLK